jgi:hypothetical protein
MIAQTMAKRRRTCAAGLAVACSPTLLAPAITLRRCRLADRRLQLLGDALLTVLEIFLLVAWFWILITVIGDLFRDHQISGWGKALWVLF